MAVLCGVCLAPLLREDLDAYLPIILGDPLSPRPLLYTEHHYYSTLNDMFIDLVNEASDPLELEENEVMSRLTESLHTDFDLAEL